LVIIRGRDVSVVLKRNVYTIISIKNIDKKHKI
jgi:hypothetical protein